MVEDEAVEQGVRRLFAADEEEDRSDVVEALCEGRGGLVVSDVLCRRCCA